MSRPRYRIAPKILALLHERGLTCAKLGQLACLSERHVMRALAGHPQVNKRSRARLIPHLTVAEITHLDWDYVTHIDRGAVLAEDISSPCNTTIGPSRRLNKTKHHELANHP